MAVRALVRQARRLQLFLGLATVRGRNTARFRGISPVYGFSARTASPRNRRCGQLWKKLKKRITG